MIKVIAKKEFSTIRVMYSKYWTLNRAHLKLNRDVTSKYQILFQYTSIDLNIKQCILENNKQKIDFWTAK